MYSGSPQSSSDSNEAFDGTPESKLTAFSPEDRAVAAKPFGVTIGGASLAAGPHDPFITPDTKGRDVKLSATASTFQPFAINAGPSPTYSSSTRVRSSSETPGTLEFLQKETLDAAEPDRFGTFTTDTGATRCMKVTSLYGANAQQLVESSLVVRSCPNNYSFVTNAQSEIGKIGKLRP